MWEFKPEDFDDETIAAFDRGWSSVPPVNPGDRRRAGLAAALNYMKDKEVNPDNEVCSDPQ